MDPLYGLDIPAPKIELEDHEIDDAQREEDARRAAFEAMLNSYDQVPDWKIKEGAMNELMEREIESRFEEQRAELLDIWEPDDENIPYPLASGIEYVETPDEDGLTPIDAAYSDHGDEVEEGELTAEERKILKDIDKQGSTVVLKTFEGILDEITGYEIIPNDYVQKYNEQLKAEILLERQTAKSWWEAAHLGKYVSIESVPFSSLVSQCF